MSKMAIVWFRYEMGSEFIVKQWAIGRELRKVTCVRSHHKKTSSSSSNWNLEKAFFSQLVPLGGVGVI